MPFMDDTMIDLFGEEAAGDALGQTIAPVHDSPALVQQVENSHLTGCCQRLAWSRTGSIAHISADGSSINFRVVARDHGTGAWSLSEDSPHPIPAPDGARFVHVEWSGLGLNLVALDQFGRIHLFTLVFALGRMQRQMTNLATPKEDLSAVVGLHWLPIYPNQYKSPIIYPASRNGNDWVSGLKVRDDDGVHHAIDNKCAFLSLTRDNVLKLVYQQDEAAWMETSLDLGDLTDSGNGLSHAAFADGSESITLAAHDSAHHLRLYSVNISWNAAKVDTQRLQQPMVVVSPQLSVIHLKSIDHFASSIYGQDVPVAANYMSAPTTTTPRLASLHFLPPHPNVTGLDSSGHILTAIFNCAGNQHGLTQQQNSSFSIIARWEVKQSAPSLHESFKALRKGKASTTGSKPATTLQELPSLSVPKVILSMASLHMGSLLAFPCSDGSVDFRDRDTLDLVAADGDDTKVTSLPQNGFAFMSTDQCTDVALSPSASMAVSLRPDGSIHAVAMEYLHGWTDAEPLNHLSQAAVVSLAREFAILCSVQYTNDEVLALVPSSLHRDLRRLLIKYNFRILQRNVDMSMEEVAKHSARVLRDSLLARLLSAQMVLSYKDTPDQHDVPRKVAWVMLNLRGVCMSIAQVVTPRDLMRPDVLLSLQGLIKWCLDIVLKVFDDLFVLRRVFQVEPVTRELLVEQIEKKGLASLHLLLCSSSRALFRFLLDMFRIYFAKAQQTPPKTVLQKLQLAEILSLPGTLPFKLTHLEALIQEIDMGVRNAYTQAKTGATERAAFELGMLVEADVPEVLVPFVTHLFGHTLDKLVKRMDEGKILFWPTAWLGLNDGAPERYAPLREYDVLRKTKLEGGMKLRSCRRCGSLMQDVSMDKQLAPPPPPQWVAMGQKLCVCLGYWMLV